MRWRIAAVLEAPTKADLHAAEGAAIERIRTKFGRYDEGGQCLNEREGFITTSADALRLYENPEYRERHREAMRDNPRVAEANRRLAQDPAWRERHAEGARRMALNPVWQAAQGVLPPAPDHEAEACRADLRQCKGAMPSLTACRRARLLHPAIPRHQFLDLAAEEGYHVKVAVGALCEAYIVFDLLPVTPVALLRSNTAAVADLPGLIELECLYKLEIAAPAHRTKSPVAGGLRRLGLRYPDLPCQPLARAIAEAGICSFALAESNINNARLIVAPARDLGIAPAQPSDALPIAAE